MVFKLDAVLSVITGINFTPFGNTCRLMDYMVGDDLADIGRVMMQPKFPALADATPPDDLNVAVAWPSWLAAMVARHGDEFDVQPVRSSHARRFSRSTESRHGFPSAPSRASRPDDSG